jgi:hypothetical protein
VLPIELMPEDLHWNAATLWAGPKCHMVHYPLQGWKTFNVVATFQTDVSNVGTNEPGTREEILSRYQEERILRAYRVVLSSRMRGKVYHAQGVERKIRNSVMGAKSPEDFYNGLQWLYGGTGLSARVGQAS